MQMTENLLEIVIQRPYFGLQSLLFFSAVLLYLLINFSYSGSLCYGSRRVFNRFVLEALAPYDTPQSYLSCLTLIYGCVHTVSHQILHPRVGHAPLLFDLIKIMYPKYCKNQNESCSFLFFSRLGRHGNTKKFCKF